jgi:hypothetical protein
VASATRPTPVVCRSSLGGLLLQVLDVLVGEQLAQPGVLVVHGRFSCL